MIGNSLYFFVVGAILLLGSVLSGPRSEPLVDRTTQSPREYVVAINSRAAYRARRPLRLTGLVVVAVGLLLLIAGLVTQIL
jgi:hypothetical protein